MRKPIREIIDSRLGAPAGVESTQLSRTQRKRIANKKYYSSLKELPQSSPLRTSSPPLKLTR